MKKIVFLVIALLYITSVVVINLVGLQPQIYDEVVPVTTVECINETDEKVTVTKADGKTTIKIKFSGPGGFGEDGEVYGTWIQLQWRVYPDNATKKGVTFDYNPEMKKYVEFFIDENGVNHGTVFIKNKISLDLKITATDGSRVGADVVIRAY